MRNKKVLALLMLLALFQTLPAQELNTSKDKRGRFFEWGNYAMFIHWGLYSQIANKWEDKTFYGIGEHIMGPNMANIPVDEYMAIAKGFNPTQFNAKEIVQLAKDAGMKYIVITSKHIDGFAMYHSTCNKFNIVDATPFKRDPMKELAEACKQEGLGFGFYYSHNLDWTYPGGTGGPKVDKEGTSKTFDNYFIEKCLPQVEEITRNYGELELIWFDAPEGMPEKYAKQLVEVVHRNQPHTLVSGRVGFDLGDYQTLGDMLVPLENIDGLWESVDVTNDSWGYAWYDENWKSPKQLLNYLISTIARGGTYMLNVGPDGLGRIPEPVHESLRAAGKWIAKYPQVIYSADASPWKHALPWGDVVVNDGKLYLAVYQWPTTGKLYLPGLKTEITSIKLLNEKKGDKLNHTKEGSWTVIHVPYQAPDPMVSVIEVTLKASPEVNTVMAVDPEFGVDISSKFARTNACSVNYKSWMEKYGEWKHIYQVDDWKQESSVSWELEIKTPGRYLVELTFAGNGPKVWRVETGEGAMIQNRQNSSAIYNTQPIGWLKFEKAGKQTVSVSIPEGDRKNTSLAAIKITPVSGITLSSAPITPSAAKTDVIEYKTDYFTYATNTNGLPFSFKLKDGTELLKESGGGYYIQHKGQDDIPLSKVSKSGEYTVFASKDDKYQLTVKINATSHYIAFTNVSFKGDLPPGATVGYKLDAGSDVTLFAFDYACEATRTTATFTRFWDLHPTNSMGGFAVYYYDSENMQDDCILRIWGNEKVPHPKIPNWSYERAKQWMDEWCEVFADQSMMYIHPQNLTELTSGAFQTYLDMADVKYVYLFTDIWQLGFWQTIYENHQVAGVFGDQAALKRYSDLQNSRGQKTMLHYLTATIGFQDPKYGGSNIPAGQLATWADGTARDMIDGNTNTIYFKPAKDWYEIPDGTITKKAVGKNTEPFRDVFLGLQRFLFYNYLQVDNEVMKISNYEKMSDGTWKLTVYDRGFQGTVKGGHAAGAQINLIILPWDQAYAPGTMSPLFDTIAINWANVLNDCKIYCTMYDGYENVEANGQWGCEKFATLVYQNLDLPVIAFTSSGSIPKSGYIEYQLNRGKALHTAWMSFTGVYRVNFNLERASTTRQGSYTSATWPLVANYNLGLAAALKGSEFSVMRPDPMFGITIKEFETHGKTAELLKLCPLWKQISKKLTDAQCAQIKTGNSSRRGITTWIPYESATQYTLTPTRMMTSAADAADQMFTFYQEDGVHPPAVEIKMEQPLTLTNHYAMQTPSFVLRFMPGNGTVNNPSVKIGDVTLTVNNNITLNDVSSVYIEYNAGENMASVYDCNWNKVTTASVSVNGGTFSAAAGSNTVLLSSANNSLATVKMTVLTQGNAIIVEK